MNFMIFDIWPADLGLNRFSSPRDLTRLECFNRAETLHESVFQIDGDQTLNQNILLDFLLVLKIHLKTPICRDLVFSGFSPARVILTEVYPLLCKLFEDCALVQRSEDFER